MAMSRAQRAELVRRAHEIRLACQRRGEPVEQVAEAIRAELPDLLALEVRRLAYGWSRPQALAELDRVHAAGGLPSPGVDSAMLCKWEHGKVTPNAGHAAALSRLYGVPAEKLGLAPNPSPTPSRKPAARHDDVATVTPNREIEGDDPVRRRELMTMTGLVIPLAVLRRVEDALAAPPDPQRPETQRQVRVRLQHAHHLNDVSELSTLVSAFPDLIASAREMADRVDTPAGFALLSECYVLMVRTLNKIGHRGAARLAAERALLIAERSGDPVAIGAASRPMGMLLRKEQRFAPAARVVERAVNGLEATGLRTPQQASTYLRIQCALAYTKGWAGKEQEALDRISEIERAAGRLSPLAGPAMGVPAIRLYRSRIHYALGDPEQALRLAEELRPQMFPTPERRARFHVDVARAAWAAGHTEQTARALLGAIAEAPGEVLERPANRRIADDLITHHPRAAGARELSTALGVRA